MHGIEFYARQVKALDKLFVRHFFTGEAGVLLKETNMTPSLQAADAAHDAPHAILALVAVDEHG